MIHKRSQIFLYVFWQTGKRYSRSANGAIVMESAAVGFGSYFGDLSHG